MWAAVVATGLVAAGLTAAGVSGWPSPVFHLAAATATPHPPPGCPGARLPAPPGSWDPFFYFPREQYPPPGLPRGANPVPYAIPFAGQMSDGTLTVGPSASRSVLGPSRANLCGTFSLPSNSGTTTTQQIYIDNPVDVHAASVQGPVVYHAYIELKTDSTSQIDPVPGTNGGLNLKLFASFRGTLVPAPGGVEAPAPGFECTTDVGPITFTTGKSGRLTGEPVTGPIRDASTYVVANDFVYPAVTPATPYAAPTPQKDRQGCNAAGAAVINTAGGLPQPPGNATFTAHASFAVHADA